MQKATNHKIVTFYTKVPSQSKKYTFTGQNKSITSKNPIKYLNNSEKRDESFLQLKKYANPVFKYNTITPNNSIMFKINDPKPKKKNKLPKKVNNSEIQTSFRNSNNKAKLFHLNTNKSTNLSKINYDEIIAPSENGNSYLNKDINKVSFISQYEHKPFASELCTDKKTKNNYLFYSSSKNDKIEKMNYTRNKLNSHYARTNTDSKIITARYKYVVEDCNKHLSTIPNNKPNNHRIHRIKIEDSKNNLTDSEKNDKSCRINSFQLPKKEFIIYKDPIPSLSCYATINVKEPTQLPKKISDYRKFTPINSNYYKLNRVFLSEGPKNVNKKIIKNFNSDFHSYKKPIKQNNNENNNESNNNNSKKKIKCEICHQYIDDYLYKCHFNNHPSKIFDWLYLGTFKNACDIKELNNIGITHILNCAYECHNEKLPRYIKELHLKISDVNHFNLSGYFEVSNKFMNDCKMKGGAVLVHCKLGISRSATFVIAYLIKCYRFTAKAALNYVRQKRKQINPNFGFMQQLEKYEKLVGEESKKIFRRRLVCDKI